MLAENRPFTVKYSMWEKYVPETQNLLIQCFEMSSLYCMYEASISLDQLKEDDQHYDKLTKQVIERILSDNQNVEIYFLEYGRVLRSYCLVDIAQIQVLKKAILLLQTIQPQIPLYLIMGSFDHQDQQLNKIAQEILIRHDEIKQCHQNLGDNMKLILSLETQSKLEECDSQVQLTPLNQSLDEAYFTFKAHQSLSAIVQQMIKDYFQQAELKKILKLKSRNFRQSIGIDAVIIILLNVIFGYFKLNGISFQIPYKQSQPIIENLLRLIRQYFFKYNEIRKKKFQLNPKISIVDAKKLVSQDYGQFRDPENQHFPEKQQNCIKCKVCRKKAGDPLLKEQGHQPIHKTKYRCKGCFVKLQRNISLCITPCFEEFHLDPEYFLSRNKKVATGSHLAVQQSPQTQNHKSSFI